MSKKKSNSRVINNIDNLNLEIDYDKLAQAIVKANLESENFKKEKIQTDEKVTLKKFIQLVCCIIFNKKQSNGMITSSLFGMFIGWFFNAIFGLGVLLFVFTFIGLIILIGDYQWTAVSLISNNIIQIVLIALFMMVIGMFSLFFRGVANEMSAETDRNYIMDVFSGVVSFVALIVSLVALIKGVG